MIVESSFRVMINYVIKCSLHGTLKSLGQLLMRISLFISISLHLLTTRGRVMSDWFTNLRSYQGRNYFDHRPIFFSPEVL